MADPTVYCAKTRMVDVKKLIPNPENPNVHTPEQIRLLVKVIQGNGWRNPIVVSKRCDYITKGHARLQAALAAGWKKVPVDYQEYIDEASEYADMVADNKIAELSYLDVSMVNPMLGHLQDRNIDMEVTGYPQAEAQSILDGWMPEQPNLDDLEANDDPAPGRVVIECPKDAELELKKRFKGYLVKAKLTECRVK